MTGGTTPKAIQTKRPIHTNLRLGQR
jgi:hypothetical protein